MAFGADYKVEEFSNKVKLDDGNYGAKIVKTEGVDKNGMKYIRVEFEVNNNPNAFPNQCCIFDSPTKAKDAESLEKAKSLWNKRMTSMFDAFGIERGNFDFRTWVGKTGTVTIQKQYNKPEYSELVPYKTKPREFKPTAAESFANAFGGSVVSDTPANVSADNFPQDMPF